MSFADYWQSSMPDVAFAVLGFSGGLVGADRLAGEITSKPPIMLVHGEQDALAPIYGMMASAMRSTPTR